MPKAAKSKLKKDPNQPKRGLSAFMFFSQEQRPVIKKENPKVSFGKRISTHKHPAGELGKRLGAAWRDMSDADKEPYVEMAAKDKTRYERELLAFKNGAAPPQSPVAAKPASPAKAASPTSPTKSSPRSPVPMQIDTSAPNSPQKGAASPGRPASPGKSGSPAKSPTSPAKSPVKTPASPGKAPGSPVAKSPTKAPTSPGKALGSPVAKSPTSPTKAPTSPGKAPGSPGAKSPVSPGKAVSPKAPASPKAPPSPGKV